MSKRIDMNHAAHFIAADSCRFFRSTFVNGYIVSTVGDYHAPFEPGPTEIGYGRLYETMVFPAKPTPRPGGCDEYPYVPAEWSELECVGYNDAAKAEAGHEKLVRKYAKEKKLKLVKEGSDE